jgi:hypothetical protein
LFLNYIPALAKKIEDTENAIRMKDLMFDLLARTPDLQIYSDRLCKQILSGFNSRQGAENIDGITINIIGRHT